MSANFEIVITGIQTTTVGQLENVVKKVDWVMKGTQEGQAFELPQTTLMGEPDAEDFIPLTSLTPETVVAWVEAAHENLPAVKAHIQIVLDRMVQETGLESAPLPWAPEPETPENP